MTAGDSDLELHPLVPVPDLLLPRPVAVTDSLAGFFTPGKTQFKVGPRPDRGPPARYSRRFFMTPAQSLHARRPFLRRTFALLAVALSMGLLSGCKDEGTPEYVADQFVEAYFQRMDQQGARQFTAFGATEMLDRELELTRGVREQGYLPAEAAAQVSWKRTGRSSRGERIRFDYDIEIRREGAQDHRSADIELSKVQAGWKVVRVAVQPR
jgi:hypothetical protein